MSSVIGVVPLLLQGHRAVVSSSLVLGGFGVVVVSNIVFVKVFVYRVTGVFIIWVS